MTMAAANQGVPLIEQNYFVPMKDGRVQGATVGTASQQMMTIDTQRASITFHNPNLTSQAVLFVCPATAANGAALPAAVDGAGSFAVLPGSSVTFVGSAVGCAWNAVASAGGSHLSIIWDTK